MSPAVPAQPPTTDRGQPRPQPRPQPQRGCGRRARDLRDHRRPREGDDLPLALPAGEARPAELPDRRRRGRRLDARAPARARARECIEGCGESLDPRSSQRFAARLSYVSGDFTNAATYERLAAAVGDARSPVFYLEIPPFLFGPVIKQLKDAGLTKTRARRRREAVRPRPRSPRARWRRKSTSTSTSHSSTGSTTSSGRWAPTSSSTCASRTR